MLGLGLGPGLGLGLGLDFGLGSGLACSGAGAAMGCTAAGLANHDWPGAIVVRAGSAAWATPRLQPSAAVCRGADAVCSEAGRPGARAICWGEREGGC